MEVRLCGKAAGPAQASYLLVKVVEVFGEAGREPEMAVEPAVRVHQMVRLSATAAEPAERVNRAEVLSDCRCSSLRSASTARRCSCQRV